MPRLLVHVEGQTEERFVNEVLSEYLTRSGYDSVGARIVGSPRMKRGGIRSWQSVKRDILRHLKEDRAAIATLMVDYYGLPQDWPGRKEAPTKSSTSLKAELIESALLTDIAKEMGPRFDAARFVPMVVMHEFEALLFSAPDEFARGIEKPELAQGFREVRGEFNCPEDINDSVTTAPSKRIQKLFPGYQKPLFGVIAALAIGLDKMREECPHFNSWLEHLESLPLQFVAVED